ncbi:uncharacterized protein CMU_019770 [Cryptosporidium muris RN66]|uniref:Uncharacterized protein n=1 Tax=Cryptosporidium muris (strain RN66) TaxID=441375 RepID=B6AJ96_CRYMR|nr:uncharacterized protein CMU_019770 [Cryptosporidium muris RN66]EEA08234.1 hypothetical protein, conserved [Cryptosporidium muris RN66]|eukprot:XP_002142583.1 hypothetical protein [Cryptosporidium muris RN66]
MNLPSGKGAGLNLLKYIKGGGKTAPRITLLIVALLTCASFMTLLFHALPVLVQEIREGPTDTYKQQVSNEKRLLSLLLNDDLNKRFRSTRLLSMSLKSLIGRDTYIILNETIVNPFNEEVEVNLSPLAIWNYTDNINNSKFICKKFLVSFNESILDNHNNGNVLDKGCINHYIKATIDNKYENVSYSINRLLAIFNGILIALKDIKDLLNNIPINKGMLIVFAANMEFTDNWQDSLHGMYKSWDNSTYTSQILLGSWGAGKPFRLNEHIPTLDFNFFVLNIPSINFSNKIINQTDSLEVVKEFINRFYNSLHNYTIEINKYSKMNNKKDEIIDSFNINNTSNKSVVNFIGSENYFFNKNINSESDKWMGVIGVSLSRIVESLKGVIVDSVNMNKNSFNIFGDKVIYRTYTQFIILSPVERKRIVKYQYENEYRRICLYQGHSDIKAILRASPARSSLAEYARYNGYAYFLYDSSFQKRIPKSIYNSWSRNGFYMKIFTALDILFWNITSIGEFLSKYMNNYSNNISEEKIYKKFLDKNIPSYKLNNNWDLYHDGKFAHIKDYTDVNDVNGEAIQFTPSNVKANICDYAVWFDIDIAITDKHVSIERLMYVHNKDTELKTGNDTYNGIIMDVSNFVMLTARDSAWNDRYSLVNSGFVIISRSRYGLQMIFHALSLDPILAESVIKYGSNWPEQTTLSHSVFYLYNNTVSTPNMTLDISKLDIKSIPSFIINNMPGPTPFLFTSKSQNNDDYQIVVIISQRLANGFLQMPPNSFGEGPWYPGDWFIHAAASKSPFRDNALAGLLYVLNSEGINSDFINYYQDACALPFSTIYNGLDSIINYLRSQLDKHEGDIQTNNNNNNISISKISRNDIIIESMKYLMSIKTRNNININNENNTYYNVKGLDNDQIFTVTCKWQLSLSLRWSIAETTTLAIATMVGVVLFTLLYLFPHLCIKRDGHIHSMKEYTEKSIMVK